MSMTETTIQNNQMMTRQTNNSQNEKSKKTEMAIKENVLINSQALNMRFAEQQKKDRQNRRKKQM